MDDLTVTTAGNAVHRFGPFRLVPDRQLLLRGETPVRLGARSFDLLALLVERRGELVTKQELMASAWPHTFVHENNLKVNMFSLRRALGDTGGDTAYIATVSGRGYRFVAPVTTSCETIPAPATPSLRRPLPPLTDMVGRATELSQTVALLRESRHVTVVGTGGMGKTTLALAAAHALQADFSDGACWVDLSAIDDPMLVPMGLFSALGLRGNPGDWLGAVIDYLGERRLLILLDNCEHILPAVAIFAGKLGTAGKSRILATSRTPLGAPGEQVIWLGPLDSPPAGTDLTIATAARYSAVQLLLTRASEWAGYLPGDEDCSALAQICRSLDGIPLAIELAASKLDEHTPQELLAMLSDHLTVLDSKTHKGPGRHRTLAGTIDWSYRLLTKDEATIFQLVSVFASKFSAADVAAMAIALGLSPAATSAALGGLVSKSLLTADADGHDLTYRLLDTTRRYGMARLDENPLCEQLHRSHAELMVEIFERSEREWDWRETGEWKIFYQDRLPDLRKALAWAFDGGDPQLGVRLAIAAIPALFEISAVAEARQLAEQALRFPATAIQRMKLANSRAWSRLYASWREPESESAWQQAIALAEGCENADYHLRALLGYSFYLNGMGRLPMAMECLAKFRKLAEDNPHLPVAADGERFFALVLGYTGKLQDARRILERLALGAPHVGQRTRMAGFQVDRYIGTRNYLSFVSWLTGNPRYASHVADNAVRAAGQLGHLLSQSNVLAISALPIAFWNGDAEALRGYTTQLKRNLEIESTDIWKPILRFYTALLPQLEGGSADVEAMRAVIDELVEARFTIRIGLYLSILADILASRGECDRAYGHLETAFDYQSRQNERWCLPELQRVDASILRRRGASEEAEKRLNTALLEARATGARSFELRIAHDLAVHCIETGRTQQARDVLGPVYREFCEGAATRDLVAAALVLRRASASSDDRIWTGHDQ